MRLLLIKATRWKGSLDLKERGIICKTKIFHRTPYSKMAEIHYSFVSHVNWPLLRRFKPNVPLNSADGIEATRAN